MILFMLNHTLFWLKLVSIMLSCVWFSHPLSWEQWIGAVSHDFNPLQTHYRIFSYPSIITLASFYNHVQVLVFGSIYARSFLRNATQKLPTSETPEDRSSSQTSQSSSPVNRSSSSVSRSSSPMKESP